jgi:hypothetical protein
LSWYYPAELLPWRENGWQTGPGHCGPGKRRIACFFCLDKKGVGMIDHHRISGTAQCCENPAIVLLWKDIL